jgi:hypothetical protein
MEAGISAHAARANAADIFRQFGLRSPGFWHSVAVPARSDGTSPGARLREAFDALGGVYGPFARFLLWRADLLNTDYLTALRQLRIAFPPVPRDQVIALLRRELGAASDELTRKMETEPAWNTFFRTAYRTKHQDETIVVQVAREPISDAELDKFEAGVRYLGHPDVRGITEAGVLREFREWLRQSESCAVERAYLDVLGRQKGQTLVDYPSLLAEITTDNVLCWTWIDGDPVSTLIQLGSVEIVTQVATAVLEQFYNLSIIDADLDLDAMAFAGGERLIMRRVGRPLSVPPLQVNVGMKYVSAVLEGDASITVQTMLSMAGQSSGRLEATLLDHLSGIEPELKVNLWYPGSAAAFESNWKALTKLDVERPLFFNCFHRNLIAIGYWNADAVSAGGRTIDALADAQWPVVDRLLRTQFSQFLSPDMARDWTVSTGILMFGAMREANRLAEEVRENNLTMGLEMAGVRGDSRHANRAVRMGILLGILLVILLACLRWGSSLPQPAASFVLAIALIALIGLFWAVSKIG